MASSDDMKAALQAEKDKYASAGSLMNTAPARRIAPSPDMLNPAVPTQKQMNSLKGAMMHLTNGKWPSSGQ